MCMHFYGDTNTLIIITCCENVPCTRKVSQVSIKSLQETCRHTAVKAAG